MYKNYFFQAIERTKRFGLNTPNLQTSNTSYLKEYSGDQISELMAQEFGDLNETDVAFQCFDLSFKLSNLLKKRLGWPSYFTIGHVEKNNEFFYKQTEQSLKFFLDNGVNSLEVDFHAWLTLPSMEILDYSLLSSVAKKYGIRNLMGKGYTLCPDELADKGIKFVPMLIGIEYLYKLGLCE